MIHLQIDEQYQGMGFDERLRAAAKAALASNDAAPNAELTIVLSDDDHLQALNARFRDINASTDVLSFPSDQIDPENGAPYLGDVIISLPRALAQAEAGGHAVEDELCLLAVHGVLHLLGFAHTEKQDKARMWQRQQEILESLDISIKVEN
jgi:probable rRNA maturation factor